MMKIFILMFLTIVIPVSADADIVYLKNGNQVEGKVIKETDDKIILKSGGVELTVHPNETKHIAYGEGAGAERPKFANTRHANPYVAKVQKIFDDAMIHVKRAWYRVKPYITQAKSTISEKVDKYSNTTLEQSSPEKSEPKPSYSTGVEVLEKYKEHPLPE